jgi:uncharacterized transporter YbjL
MIFQRTHIPLKEGFSFVKKCTVEAIRRFLLGLTMFVIVVGVLIGQAIFEQHVAEATKNIQQQFSEVKISQ